MNERNCKLKFRMIKSVMIKKDNSMQFITRDFISVCKI